MTITETAVTPVEPEAVETAKAEGIRCQCGAVVPVLRDRWENWVQLAHHGQPRTGLLCSPTRLQRK